MPAEWKSIHIYISDQQDALLADLFRFLESLRANGAVTRYWFIRHWNGGPHIRLRFELGLKDSAATFMIHTFAEQWISTQSTAIKESDLLYIAAAPEKPITYNQRYPLLDPEPIEARQSGIKVASKKFTFDEARYGAGAMIEVVEEHFCTASSMALAVIPKLRGNANARLTLGMHIVTVAGRVFADREKFSELMSDQARWLEIVYPDLAEAAFPSFGLLAVDCDNPLYEDVIAAFEQKGNDKCTRTAGYLNKWADELERQSRKISEICNYAGAKLNRESAITDFTHLMLNRLGLSIVEECYLYSIAALATRDEIRALR